MGIGLFRKNWYVDLYWLIGIGIFAAPMLIMGLVYKSQCPAQEWIPLLMIIQGTIACFSIILGSFLVWIVFKKSSGKLFMAVSMTKNIYILHEQIFTIVLLVYSSFLIFSIIHTGQFDNLQAQNYCNGTAYRYAFAMIILYSILMILRFCYMCFNSRSK